MLVLFVFSHSSECFGCGREEHLIQARLEKSLNETVEGQKEKRVNVETQEGTGEGIENR